MGNINRLSKARYGWTKYGGARQGLVKQNGNWYCQACGREHPDSMPAYMMCVDNGQFRDFVRLCAGCENLVKVFNIKDFDQLKEIVKRKPQWIRFSIIFKEIGLENL